MDFARDGGTEKLHFTKFMNVPQSLKLLKGSMGCFSDRSCEKSSPIISKFVCVLIDLFQCSIFSGFS